MYLYFTTAVYYIASTHLLQLDIAYFGHCPAFHRLLSSVLLKQTPKLSNPIHPSIHPVIHASVHLHRPKLRLHRTRTRAIAIVQSAWHMVHKTPTNVQNAAGATTSASTLCWLAAVARGLHGTPAPTRRGSACNLVSWCPSVSVLEPLRRWLFGCFLCLSLSLPAH